MEEPKAVTDQLLANDVDRASVARLTDEQDKQNSESLMSTRATALPREREKARDTFVHVRPLLLTSSAESR
jgi:hypothetical protein